MNPMKMLICFVSYLYYHGNKYTGYYVQSTDLRGGVATNTGKGKN